MKMNFFNVSFKGIDTTAKNKKTNKTVSVPRYSETNKYKKNESIVEPFDNGLAKTQKFGVAYPTPYEFCYDRMSFEKDDDTVGSDIFRDAEYEDELKSTHSYNRKGKFADTTIEDLNYRYQNYSYDDIPLSESLLRQQHGFYESPCIEIDTDIDDEELTKLDAINYRENIIPAALKCNTEDIWEFASEAAYFKHSGYSSQAIARALERCFLTSVKDGQTKPNIELFSFLVEHPNLRPDVLAKHPEGGAVFDKAFANNFKIFSEYYFNNEESIKYALNLCKTKDGEFKLVSKELCEILGLLRRKTAQGIPYEHNPRYDYEGRERNKFEKYVAKGTPLTPNDVKLLSKLKPKGRLDADAFEVTKQLFSVGNVSVSFVLENMDKFVSRKREIQQVLSELVESTDDKKTSSVNGIKYILDMEFGDAINSPMNFDKKCILLETTKKLMQEGLDVADIAVVLKKLKDIGYRVPLKDDLVDKYLMLLKDENKTGKNVVDTTLADILTKLVLISSGIRDVDVEIVTLLKANKSEDTKLLDLVNNMINRTSDKNAILASIREKITADELAKQQKENSIANKKQKSKTTITSVSTDSASIISPSAKVVNVSHTDNHGEEVGQNIQLAKISKMLISTRQDVSDIVSAGKIISIIQSGGKDKQILLDEVRDLLSLGYGNKKILDTITKNISLVKDTTSVDKTEARETAVADSDQNYISKLVNERLSDEQIKAVEERIEKDLASKTNFKEQTEKVYSDNSYVSKLVSERIDTTTSKSKNLYKETFSKEEINAEIKKIHTRLVGSSRMLEPVDASIVSILEKAKIEKQPKLISLVNEMLDKWCRSKDILATLRNEEHR